MFFVRVICIVGEVHDKKKMNGYVLWYNVFLEAEPFFA